MIYYDRLQDSEVDRLLNEHQEGVSLARPFYNDPTIFEEEFKHIISRQWQYTDHISRIPNKGDFFLFRIVGEEIVIIRGEGDTVYAHHNICRHRGSRVCLEQDGNTKRLTCPYHAWSYRIDGRLANARAMPEHFKPEAHSLLPCQVRIFEGFIFINLSKPNTAVPNFDTIEQQLKPWLARADLRHTKVAAHELYPSKVNWKIALENYFECYHCVTAHPELCKVQLHTLRDAFEKEETKETFNEQNRAWQEIAKNMGHMTGSMIGNTGLPEAENYNAQSFYAERMLVHNDPDGAYAKLNLDYDKVASSKLLGSYQEDDGGQVDWGILPSAFLYTSCTSTVIMRITPISPTETEMAQTWLVHEDAVEGVDYDLESLTWVDKITMEQDEEIVRNTQAGATSRYYLPGPYAVLEEPILGVHRDYIRSLRYGRLAANSHQK